MQIFDKNIVVFGAGSLAVKAIQEFRKDSRYTIKRIYDNDIGKQGTIVEGVPVEHTANIRLEDDEIIVIASSYVAEIQQQLELIGMTYNQSYVVLHEVLPQITGIPMKFSARIDELDFLGERLTYSVDPVGVLVKKNNDLYRAIYRQSESDSLDIIDMIKNKNYYSGKIIKTEITEFSTKNFPLILKHPFIEFCSDSRSWAYSMKLESMRFMLGLLMELHADGLTLKDGHFFNLTYANNNFCWIDFGSLKKGQVSTNALKEFVKSLVFHLVLMKNIPSEEYRKYSTLKEIDYFMIESFLSAEGKKLFEQILKNEANDYKGYRFLEDLKIWSDSYFEKSLLEEQTMWSRYQSDYNSMNQAENEKLKVIKQYFSRIKGETLIDLAGNNGSYCIEAFENFGYRGILTDYDYQCIDNAFIEFKKRKIDFVPLVNDFNAFPDNLFYVKHDNGFDTVLCLAFVHHLIFSNGFTFDKIVEKLKLVTNSNLIIEYVGSNDQYVRPWMNPFFSWYTQENFENAFKEEFIIESKESISDSRTLYLMHKKRNIKS